MPELPSSVDYETFYAHVCAGEGSLFGWLEELAKSGQKATVRQLCETWFDLLTTDAIQRWLLSSDWAVSDREHDFQVLDPVLSLLLRRHLLHLGTRRDVSKLSGFWRWATKLDPKLAECWDGARFDLALLPDQSVVQQEAAFVTLLTEMDRALDGQRAYAAFPWVQSVLGRVLTERRLPLPGHRATQASVRVVFAIEQPHPLLRPGIVVTFRLLSAADPQSFLQPAEVFDTDFRKSLQHVQNLVGFTDQRVMAHDWGWLPDGFLKDTSGSLAIWLAQFLAAGHACEDRYTLPPWLVMSATLDPRRSGIGGGAAPVGLLPAKLRCRAASTARPAKQQRHSSGVPAFAERRPARVLCSTPAEK